LRDQRVTTLRQLESLGALTVVQLEARRIQLESEITTQATRLARESTDAAEALAAVKNQLQEARRAIVETEDLALLQEVGVYKYRHPLTDAVLTKRNWQRSKTRSKP
jgi:hypothetical protein